MAFAAVGRRLLTLTHSIIPDDRGHSQAVIGEDAGSASRLRVTMSFEVAPPAHRFEAGTPFIEGAIALGAALDYVQRIGLPAIAAWEAELLAHATERLREIRGLRLVGTARHKAAVASLAMEGVHPHDVGTILDQEGIAVRAGHHCAQPVMARFGVPATTRASFGLYNRMEDGSYAGWAVVVVETSDGRVSGLHHFIYPELFAEFGLPLRLDAEHLGKANELEQPA